MDEVILKKDLCHIMMLNQKILKPFEIKMLSDLTMLQFRTLCVLNSEGGLSLNHLAKIQNITKQQQSFIIKGLVDEGYISKEADEKDRRITRFTITQKGIALIDNQLSFVVESIILRLKQLDKHKQEEAFNAIHCISSLLKEIV